MSVQETLKGSIEAYLKANYDTVTLTALSDHYSYSSRQMRRYIRSFYGMSFPALVNRYKLANVRRCTESGLSLSQAVAASGFSSVGYYHRVLSRTLRP